MRWILITLLFCAPVAAQDQYQLVPPYRVSKSTFDFSIDGDPEVLPGDLIFLDAVGDYKSIVWVLVGSEKRYCVVNDGAGVVFASGTPGIYSFVASAADAEGNAAAAVFHVRVVGPKPPPKPDPEPDPEPVPPPKPDPIFPPGKFGLSAWAYNNRTQVIGDPLVNKPVATSLSNNFRAVASQIAAGAIRDKQSAVNALQQRNRSSLGAHVHNWAPFLSSLGAELSRLDPQMPTVHDLQTAFTEIADGLKEFR